MKILHMVMVFSCNVLILRTAVRFHGIHYASQITIGIREIVLLKVLYFLNCYCHLPAICQYPELDSLRVFFVVCFCFVQDTSEKDFLSCSILQIRPSWCTIVAEQLKTCLLTPPFMRRDSHTLLPFVTDSCGLSYLCFLGQFYLHLLKCHLSLLGPLCWKRKRD